MAVQSGHFAINELLFFAASSHDSSIDGTKKRINGEYIREPKRNEIVSLDDRGIEPRTPRNHVEPVHRSRGHAKRVSYP